MTPPLVLTDVRVRIRDTEVLSGISLTVEQGRAVGLVGESGSGKTMTVRAATGLLGRIHGRVTQGTITLGGRDMSAASDRQWNAVRGRTLALVPQNSLSSLDPIMTVGRQLRETIKHAGDAGDWRGEARRLLHMVHLEPSPRVLRAYPHELSGGMRQRVVIALALAVRPALLVADEPTTALDAAVRTGILDLLNELRRDGGLSLVLVSHDLTAIRSTTDHVVVMHRGRAVESGPTDAVISAPGHPYTRSLLLSRPGLAVPGQPIPAVWAEDYDAPPVRHADPAPRSHAQPGARP
jgi:ABC-type dipeptide/oligopeptide/nickel transport system ATPase component